MGRFSGKTALVTGSTQGLGEAVAERFTAGGLSGLVVTGRDRDRGEAVRRRMAEGGCEAIFVAADLTDPGAAARLIDAADQHFGRLDILVNAAGDTCRGTVEDTGFELYERLMAVNFRAPFQLLQGAARLMKREGAEGSIVNISSIVAHGGPAYLTIYSASKGALVTLTRNAAHSLSWDRIRVNALNIGWMDSPAEHALRRDYYGWDDDWLEKAEADQPFGRLLKTGEVAEAVAFLASEDSGMMTGAIIDFNQMIMGCEPRPPERPS